MVCANPTCPLFEHAPVLHDRVGEELGGGRHGDALLVAELVEAALDAKVPLPEGAVRGAARHGPEQVRVDLDHLLDGARGNVGPLRGARVHGHHDAVVELEGQRGGALGELELLVRVRPVPDAEVGLAEGARVRHGGQREALRGFLSVLHGQGSRVRGVLLVSLLPVLRPAQGLAQVQDLAADNRCGHDGCSVREDDEGRGRLRTHNHTG